MNEIDASERAPVLRKKVLLAGYLKSGNTWLGYMLSHLLNAEYIEPNNYLSGIYYTPDPRVIELTSGDLPGRVATGYRCVVKTHWLPNVVYHLNRESPPLTDKVLLVVRDPRDVAVSYLHYQRLSPDSRRTGIGMLKPVSFFNTLRAWRDHTAAWLERKPHVVRYEDLLADCHATLARILAYLDEPPDATVIDETVRAFEFGKLKSSRSEFTQNFFRKGVVGDHAGYFGWAERKMYQRYCAALATSLGYE
jgi:hypothetical protein